MLLNNSVPNRHHLGHVVRVLAAQHQEFQGSQESLDPRDHPAIVDLKDPRDQEETKVMKDLVESKAPRAIQVLWDQPVQQEAKVNQEFADSRVLKVPRELQDRWDGTGSSAFLRV